MTIERSSESSPQNVVPSPSNQKIELLQRRLTTNQAFTEEITIQNLLDLVRYVNDG